MIEIILIPNDRKAILIGKNGLTKEAIERKTHTKIIIKDDISIDGEYSDIAKANEIIRAIGRGFSPQRALNLVKENYHLDIISLKGTRNNIERLKSRVIGKAGKARKRIEILTGAYISVYGKTISIIGKYKEMELAKKAIEMLLVGRTHYYVYDKIRGSME